MSTQSRILASALAATTALTLAAAPALAEDVDWTGGRPLPPGTQVPFDPGYATSWRSYPVIRLGDPNFRNTEVQGIRMMGKYDKDWIMCLSNAKGGLWGCYVDGEKATELGYGTYGKVVTVDPMVKPFQPVISFFIHLPLHLQQLSSTFGSSRF